MRLYSACIEWLSAEEGAHFADRIRRADAAGLKAIEFRRLTTNLVAEPMIAALDTVKSIISAVLNPDPRDGTCYSDIASCSNKCLRMFRPAAARPKGSGPLPATNPRGAPWPPIPRA